MLRRRFVLILVLAAVMGLLTSYLVYQTVKTARASQPETEEIVLAAANISLGEALTAQHIKVAPWPKSTIPPGAVRSAKNAEGRVARATMVAGEPILDAKLAPAGQGGLLPVLIPSGKRAVTIKVDEAVQKSGFVVPNSRVDVLVTMARTYGETKVARMVLQDILVLASDQTVEMKDNKPVTMTTVTMAMSPEEVERLALAQNEGKVTLALRNLQDNDRISTPGITTAQLLGTPAPAAAPAAKRGTKSTRPAHSAVRGASTPAVTAAATPPAAMPPSQAQPGAPTAQTFTVSVIRGVNAADTVFVQHPDGGWHELTGKSESPKRPQP